MFLAIFRNLMMMLLVLAAGSSTISFAAERRVALVIGNSAYQHASVLGNPKNDAIDMAAAVEKLGFKVIRGLDLDKSGMDRTMRQFAEALKGAGVGMFFYAGHGLQVSGRNYLVPVDAELKTAEALDFEMIGLDVVQRIMEAATETNILFVDACRDNPLSRNLARAMGTRSAAIGNGLVAQEAGAGTLISFSTQPGNVALDGTGKRNSPYAGALVKHLPTKGKDLPAVLVQVRRDVMATTAKRQIPWEHSALTAEVMLAPDGPSRTAAGDATKADASENSENRAASGPEAKVAAANPASGPEAEPGVATQRVLKASANKGTLKIINNKNSEFLYNENGRKILVSEKNATGAMPVNEAVELPSGRYTLKSDGDIVTVKGIHITAGENVVIDFQKTVGSLRVTNSKEDQYLFVGDRRIWFDPGPAGKTNMGAIPTDKPMELPPGRYHLKSRDPLQGVEPFDIKVGEETVIDFGG